MREKYKEIHWGASPTRTIRVSGLKGRARPVGAMRALSYVSKKGTTADVFRHEFETSGGRRAQLLEADASGPVVVDGPPSSIVELGYVVDIELHGERVFCSGIYIASDDAGRPHLVGLHGCANAIGRRGGWPYITAAGLEG